MNGQNKIPLWGKILLGVVVVALTLFGIVVVGKAAELIYHSGVALALWAQSGLQFVLSASVVLLPVFAVVLAAVWMVEKIREQFLATTKRLDEMARENRESLAAIKERLAPKPDKIAPVLITGFVQTLVLTLKDSAIVQPYKTLLSVCIWVIATIVTLCVFEQKSLRQLGWLLAGVFVLVLMATLAFLGVSVSGPQWAQQWQNIRDYWAARDVYEMAVVIFIALVMLTMPLGVAIVHRKRKGAADPKQPTTGEAQPKA